MKQTIVYMGTDDRVNSLSLDISRLVDFISGAWRRTTMYRGVAASVYWAILGNLSFKFNDALVS